jgi:ABC-type antimicrobial peptide transport system permease subunit
MLLLQGLAPVTVGLAFGAAAALGLGKYLNHLIESAQPVGTWTCAAAALLLASTGAIAVWTATSRILRIDPMRALRTE